MKFVTFLITIFIPGLLMVSEVSLSTIKESHGSVVINLNTNGENKTNSTIHHERNFPIDIPEWIVRSRRTKVLEKPLESQLRFHEHAENKGGERENFLESESTSAPVDFSSFTTSRSTLLNIENRVGAWNAVEYQGRLPTRIDGSGIVGSGKVPIVRVAGVQRQDKYTDNNHGTTIHKMRPAGKEPVRRQDIDLISLITEAPPLELTSVSPFESSLGGLTGLQGLPPLSIIQFIKMLVAITPFMIPIVFVPLLIFTIGIFMIPVAKSNVFIDVDNLRSFGHLAEINKQQAQSLSGYLGSIKNFTRSVVIPRAHTFGQQFFDHEECIERLSCKVSARYLHHEWNGNWRSIANRSWIARILNYVGKRHPTAARIMRSLHFDIDPNEGSSLGEFGNQKKKISNDSSLLDNSCSQYKCQPISFLRKFVPS